MNKIDPRKGEEWETRGGNRVELLDFNAHHGLSVGPEDSSLESIRWIPYGDKSERYWFRTNPDGKHFSVGDSANDIIRRLTPRHDDLKVDWSKVQVGDEFEWYNSETRERGTCELSDIVKRITTRYLMNNKSQHKWYFMDKECKEFYFWQDNTARKTPIFLTAHHPKQEPTPEPTGIDCTGVEVGDEVTILNHINEEEILRVSEVAGGNVYTGGKYGFNIKTGEYTNGQDIKIIAIHPKQQENTIDISKINPRDEVVIQDESGNIFTRKASEIFVDRNLNASEEDNSLKVPEGMRCFKTLGKIVEHKPKQVVEFVVGHKYCEDEEHGPAFYIGEDADGDLCFAWIEDGYLETLARAKEYFEDWTLFKEKEDKYV